MELLGGGYEGFLADKQQLGVITVQEIMGHAGEGSAPHLVNGKAT